MLAPVRVQAEHVVAVPEQAEHKTSQLVQLDPLRKYVTGQGEWQV